LLRLANVEIERGPRDHHLAGQRIETVYGVGEAADGAGLSAGPHFKNHRYFGCFRRPGACNHRRLHGPAEKSPRVRTLTLLVLVLVIGPFPVILIAILIGLSPLLNWGARSVPPK